MADVRPFRGLRYSPALAARLPQLLTPPYDVIGPDEQRALHEQDPLNCVRLELGMAGPGDTAQENRYSRSRATLDAWLKDGVLVREQAPAFYLCRHEFRHEGRKSARWELLCQVRLEPWERGVILPHELTLPEAKADRLNLLRATETNVSPIWSVYPDPSGSLQALLERQAHAEPAAQADWRGASFTVWAITEGPAVEEIRAHLAGCRLYIADGHHRYETALAYQRERRQAVGAPEAPLGSDYVFMSLVSLEDPGLLVLPIHRVIRRASAEQVAGLRAGLAREWQATEGGWSADGTGAERDGAPGFAVHGLEPGKTLSLRPRDPEGLRRQLPADWSPALRELDLALLHEVVLHGYMGLGRSPADIEGAMTFAHEAREARGLVDSGAARLAFLVRPTPVQAMVRVAEARATMPQKSTFFYPKLPVGLVLSPVEG